MRAFFFIGLRYAFSRRDNKVLSLITWVSIIGVGLGVAALIVVTSVMNGFEKELKQRILGAVPHVVVEGLPKNQLAALDNVVSVTRFTSQPALLVNESISRLVTVFGIEPGEEHHMSNIPNKMVNGSMNDLATNRSGIVLGTTLALRLGLTHGSDVTMILPILTGNDILKTEIVRTTLIGTFSLESELDYNIALMNFDPLVKLINQDLISYRLRLDNVFNAPLITKELEDVASRANDWSREHGDFFRAVKMEKIMMFILLLLIVAIASFTIVSCLSMAVKGKKSDIAILRSCGLSKYNVTLIFMMHGTLIGICGVSLGALVGLPLAYYVTEVVSAIESFFGVRVLAGTYFNSIPSDIRFNDIAIVIVASLVVSIVATIYPAYRASKLKPVDILRYS